jgi:hypothetical protein
MRCPGNALYVRRVVRDYVAAALDRLKPQLGRYIATHLECPETLAFTDPVVSVQEVRSLKIVPRLRADFPPLDVVITMRVSVTARTQHRGIDKGIRTTAVDLLLKVLATAQAEGYRLEPQRSRLTAWWGNL